MDTKTDRSIALALHWARNNAGEHADTIIEALAAYDTERVGARTVAKPAQWHESLRSYMDAWCKIVETLDDIRPAWAESDGESVADCACRTIRELAAQAPERRAVTDEDVRRACDAWDRSKMVGANRVAVHMRAALESFAGVPAAQPADEIADLTKRLAAAQRPFDPDVAEVIRKGWDTLFDDAQPAPDAAREPADAQLADTQRAIIEAAEARGYARAKVEGEANDEAPELRQTVLILRNALARAMEWNWLDDDARPSGTALLCDAALASVDAMLAAAPPNGETE